MIRLYFSTTYLGRTGCSLSRYPRLSSRHPEPPALWEEYKKLSNWQRPNLSCVSRSGAGRPSGSPLGRTCPCSAVCRFQTENNHFYYSHNPLQLIAILRPAVCKPRSDPVCNNVFDGPSVWDCQCWSEEVRCLPSAEEGEKLLCLLDDSCGVVAGGQPSKTQCPLPSLPQIRWLSVVGDNWR